MWDREYLTNTFLPISFDAVDILTQKNIGMFVNIGGTCGKNCVQFHPVYQNISAKT